MNTNTSSKPLQVRELPPQDDPLFLRGPLRHELEKRGYKISPSYWNKINLPSVNAGPPVEKWWGKRPLHRLSAAIQWAESRCSMSRGKLVA